VLPLIDEIKAALGEAADALRLDELRETAERCLREAANLKKAKDEDPDEVPEVPIVPITQPGELWLLGDHRIICGDSRDPDVLARLMDGKQAVLYHTDPPYGVGYDGMNHPKNLHAKTTGHRDAGNRDWSADYHDHNAWDHFEDMEQFEQMLIDVFTVAKPHTIEDAAWYCWHASATMRSFLDAWERTGIRFHQSIVWVKPCAVLGFSMWNWRNEPCLMGWQQGHKPAVYHVPDELTNVWEVDWEGKARCTDGAHPTQKPVRLFELPMLKHTNPGEICLETFSGSGSQIIAAERLSRRCFAVERMPQFVDVAVKRWELMTGKQAVRA
jgi:DNA modification methylase